MLDEAGGGFRLVTRPELNPYLRKFFDASRSNRLSMAALETLATVAYRQPITAPEIQEVRGKNSAGVLKTLLERHLIRISGRKDVVGKPFLYSTTRDFLLHFGLNALDDLPPLEEFEETFLNDGDFSGDPTDRPLDREEEVLQQLALLDEGAAGEDESEGEDSTMSRGDLEEEARLEAAVPALPFGPRGVESNEVSGPSEPEEQS
jgi:segregation and condensation protein B